MFLFAIGLITLSLLPPCLSAGRLPLPHLFRGRGF